MLSFFSSSSSFLSLVYFFLSRLLLFQFTPHSVFCFFFFSWKKYSFLFFPHVDTMGKRKQRRTMSMWWFFSSIYRIYRIYIYYIYVSSASSFPYSTVYVCTHIYRYTPVCWISIEFDSFSSLLAFFFSFVFFTFFCTKWSNVIPCNVMLRSTIEWMWVYVLLGWWIWNGFYIDAGEGLTLLLLFFVSSCLSVRKKENLTFSRTFPICRHLREKA